MRGGRHQVAVAGAIALPALVLLALHVFEPRLSLTWAYAHLGRLPGGRILALVVAAALPLVVLRLERLPGARRPAPVPSWRAGLFAALAFSLVFLGAGWLFPAEPVSIDAHGFALQVWKGVTITSRWYLMLVGYGAALRVAEWIAPFPVPARDLVPFVNAFVSGLAYALLWGCARRLGRDAFEVGVVAALAWTAFGNLQLCFWYMDIYPFVQLATVLFLWTSFRACAGETSFPWPLLVAALAPLFYVGLILLAPAALVVALAVAGTKGGVRRVGLAALVGFLFAGLAMAFEFGRPFAFAAYLAELSNDSARELGLQPGSNLLPTDYMLSGFHLWEWIHTLMLVDGVGLLLCATVGLPLLARVLRGEFATPTGLLFLVLGPILFYSFVMDPLWGAYADWDLFSYAAVPSSLLGAHALVVWGRGLPRRGAALAGLLVAVNVVHLAARLNALDVDRALHERESPTHLLVIPQPPAPPAP